MQPSPIEPDGLFDGLRWSPIVRWAALDIVLTLVLVVPVMLYLAGAAALSDDEETATQALNAALASPDFLLWSFVLGLSITVYAGFRASRAAGTLHLRHGGWIGLKHLQEWHVSRSVCLSYIGSEKRSWEKFHYGVSENREP